MGIIAIQRFLNKNPDSNVLIIVPTDSLKIQWLQVLSRSGVLDWCSVEIINTAIKRSYNIGLLIIDEIHRIASLTFARLFEVCKYGMVLGLTSTYSRLDGKHEILIRYAPVCDTVTLKEATENKWVASYKEYKVLLDVDLTEYHRWNEQFLEHFVFFNHDFQLAMD